MKGLNYIKIPIPKYKVARKPKKKGGRSGNKKD